MSKENFFFNTCKKIISDKSKKVAIIDKKKINISSHDKQTDSC